MRVDKKGLCNILGVKNDALKVIERNGNLEKRLSDKGYNLIQKRKEGRKIYYEVEQVNESKNVYNNLLKYVYSINREEQFTKYFGLRTLTNDKFPLNKSDISNKVNISTKTITKWDNKLLDRKIISKDGFYYFYIDRDNGEIKQCSKEEYSGFWKNRAIENNIKRLIDKYDRGEISIIEMLRENSDFTTKINIIDNKYYFRVKKYKTNEDNQLYIDTWNLIKSVYGNEEYFKPTFDFIDIEDIKFIPNIRFKNIRKDKFKITLKKII